MEKPEEIHPKHAKQAKHALSNSMVAPDDGLVDERIRRALHVRDVAESVPAMDEEAVGASAALISICTIISRITGFARTWAMAYALGATFLSSSYQIANNLPNMLYELVMGGMLTTAFLPVYMSLKKKAGKEQSNAYASNLLTLVVMALGILSILCMVFPSEIIYTQSFYSDQSEMATASLFFQFFAIQIVFYGASSIISGVLNANRDYLWGAIAPVFNNIVVIVTFFLYAAIAPQDPIAALYIIAIGSPLGVLIQLLIQIPGLRRNGIGLKVRLNLKDPALRETAALGIPALAITICGFITVSVANAASYSFADNGPSVIAYSRLWFTFPYSFLAVPVCTAMFTELSNMQAEDDTHGVIRGILSGSSQILFLMIPFALYLVVFAEPLVTLYRVGAFTSDVIGQIALYLAVMALALPFYSVNTYLQMVFSSIRKMRACSIIILVGSIAQVAVIMASASLHSAGAPLSIEMIAVGTIASYLISDVLAFAYLARLYGTATFRISPLVKSCLHGLGLGLLGALAGGAVLYGLCWMITPINGSFGLALGYVIAGGLVSLAVTFIPAIKKELPEAVFVTGLWKRISSRSRKG